MIEPENVARIHVKGHGSKSDSQRARPWTRHGLSATRVRGGYAAGMDSACGKVQTGAAVPWHRLVLTTATHDMSIRLGPHLSQLPYEKLHDVQGNETAVPFLEKLQAWKPPVCLVVLDILPSALKNVNEVGKPITPLRPPPPPAPPPPAAIRYATHLSVADLKSQIANQTEVHTRIGPIYNANDLDGMQVIGRIFMDDVVVKNHIMDHPEMTAQYHHNLVLAVRELLRASQDDPANGYPSTQPSLADRVNYWVVANEVLADNPAEMDLLARYEYKRTELAGTTYGCGLFVFSTGKPDLVGVSGETYNSYTELDTVPQWDPATQMDEPSNPLARWQRDWMARALNRANTHNQNTTHPPHVLLLHQYFKPDGEHPWVDAAATLTDFNYRKQVGRFEHHVLDWFHAAYPNIKVVVSEYGADGRIYGDGSASLGWKSYPAWRLDNAQGENCYMAALKRLDELSRNQSNVIMGYCIFALGEPYGSNQFWSYRLDSGPDSFAGAGPSQVLDGLVTYAQSLRLAAATSDPVATPIQPLPKLEEGRLRVITPVLNVRRQPFIDSQNRIGEVCHGTVHRITGRNAESDRWWQIEYPPGTDKTAWVCGASDLVQVLDNPDVPTPVTWPQAAKG